MQLTFSRYMEMTRRKCTKHCAAPSVWGQAAGVPAVPWDISAQPLTGSWPPDHQLMLPRNPWPSWDWKGESRVRSYWGWRSCGVKNRDSLNNAGPEQNCGAGPWSWGPGITLKVRDWLRRAGEEERQESRQHSWGSPSPLPHTMGTTQPSCPSWNRDTPNRACPGIAVPARELVLFCKSEKGERQVKYWP